MARLYDRRRWRRRSRAFLALNPMCRMCEEIGKVTLATVVDHIRPHRGDESLFFDESNWQGLCPSCHSGAKREIERSGTLRGCDIHGVPLDPGHHWNTERGGHPKSLKKSEI